jgi:hypothetical protein
MMQLSSEIAGSKLATLVDSGSTHCFMGTDTTWRRGLKLEPRLDLKVTVANDDRVQSTRVRQKVPMLIGREEFTIDIFMIPVAGYELVLGCQWLRTLGPITWDLIRLSMAF